MLFLQLVNLIVPSAKELPPEFAVVLLFLLRDDAFVSVVMFRGRTDTAERGKWSV